MKKFSKMLVGLLFITVVGCNAPEPGSEIHDGNDETELEGRETDTDVNTRTEEDATMEEKYGRDSDEDPVADSLPENL